MAQINTPPHNRVGSVTILAQNTREKHIYKRVVESGCLHVRGGEDAHPKEQMLQQ